MLEALCLSLLFGLAQPLHNFSEMLGFLLLFDLRYCPHMLVKTILLTIHFGFKLIFLLLDLQNR